MAANPMKLAAGLVMAGQYDFPGSRQFKRGDTTPAERFSDAAAEKTMTQDKNPVPSVPVVKKPKGLSNPVVKGKF